MVTHFEQSSLSPAPHSAGHTPSRLPELHSEASLPLAPFSLLPAPPTKCPQEPGAGPKRGRNPAAAQVSASQGPRIPPGAPRPAASSDHLGPLLTPHPLFRSSGPRAPAPLPQANPEPGAGLHPGTGSGPGRTAESRTVRAAPRLAPGLRRAAQGGLARGPAPPARAALDSPSYCRSTRTSRKGNTEPSRLVTEPGATMSEGAGGEGQQGCGTHQPRRRSDRSCTRPPAVSASSGLSRGGRPVEGSSGGRGPGYATPRAPPRSNRSLPSLFPTGLARVVVLADRLRRPTPRPAPDRVTWKLEKRLRPLVAELSGSCKPSRSAGGRRQGRLCGARRVRMRRPRKLF